MPVMGLTWNVAKDDPSSFYDFLEAMDDNNLIACSKEGHGSDASVKIVKTINGGSSWQTLTLPPNVVEVYYATFLNSLQGVMNTTDLSNTYFYYTPDGGSTWKQTNIPTLTTFYSGKMHFINDSTGYALSGLYDVYKTVDTGRIWEPLPRDNSFSYLGYTNNDLFFYNANQFWTGGGVGLLQLTTNGGGTPIPQAYFQIDTINLFKTDTVTLLNYSRTGYQYKWYKNNQLIGTTFNTSYKHIATTQEDTLTLIVSNGITSDTATNYLIFFSLPDPVISAFTPDQGGTGTIITITGSYFNNVTSVKIAGTPASSYTVNSPNEITATVAAGTSFGDITVTTTAGSSSCCNQLSNGYYFTFFPTPVVTSFTPVTGPKGTVVTISGVNFTGVTGVSFGNVSAASFTFINDTTVRATLDSGATGLVSLTNPGGTGTKSRFVFIYPPLINSFLPNNGGPGTVVTIKGANFTGLDSIKFGGTPASSFNVVSDSVISAVVGNGATGNLTIYGPGGTDSVGPYTFTGPLISSFTPNISGPGIMVTITGTNFTGATAVSFGGVSASSFSVLSDTVITAVIGSGATGDVTVTTPKGSGSSNGFSFSSSIPIITGFTPAYGNIGSTVTIEGTNFSPVVADNIVYFGSVKATVVSATNRILTVTVPMGATFQPLSVTVGGLTTYSGNSFITTFNVGGNIANTNFTSVFNYTAGVKDYGVCAGDMDGDGKADVIVALNDSVCIFRNLSVPGTITLANPVDISMPGVPQANIEAADIDGDGKLDIICGTTTGVYVLHNTTVGSTISFSVIQVSPYAAAHIAVNDINEDGKPDIIYVNGSNVIVLKNTSANSSISFSQLIALKSSPAHTPVSVTICDIDGDGKPDIIASNYYVLNYGSPYSIELSVFRNISTADSIQFGPDLNYGPPGIYEDVSTGDINGDGKPDIVVVNTASYSNTANTVTTGTTWSVIPNTSNIGTINIGSPSQFNGGFYPSYISVGSLNGDSKPDIVTTDDNGNLFLSQNSSSGSNISFTNAQYSFPEAKFTAIQDLDGDGKPDIILNNGNYKISIIRNQIGEPTSTILCPPSSGATLQSNLTGSSYQWQMDIDTGFSNLTDNATIYGSQTSILQLSSVPSSWYGYQFRCIVNGAISTVYKITFADTWTGSESSLWENNSNWSCNQTPDANTGVIINSGTPVLSSNTTVRSVTINPSASLTISSTNTLTITH